ncbi:hypothetical protein CTKZ_04430 [Cellulomonas algicola]|uniref:Uncharacterized protein n=1 Tax=Cellulomonas algicola TaxID=2071633 RepID=A0A401UW22_9CELL|nr:hypothetical protein CTKZ_04430 [Cellulomonas algicola]
MPTLTPARLATSVIDGRRSARPRVVVAIRGPPLCVLAPRWYRRPRADSRHDRSAVSRRAAGRGERSTLRRERASRTDVPGRVDARDGPFLECYAMNRFNDATIGGRP